MSGNDDRVQPEQDTAGPGDDLPTYDDLASQSGPNSRLDLLSITSKCGMFNFFSDCAFKVWSVARMDREKVCRPTSKYIMLSVSIVWNRAAERYRDLTSEERQRRRARGWGNDGDQVCVFQALHHSL